MQTAQQAAKTKVRERKQLQQTAKALHTPIINNNVYKVQLAGFAKAAKHYPAFNIIDKTAMPQIAGGVLLQIQFKKTKEYGLCLYNENTEMFEERPGTYKDYRTNQTKVEDEYGFTHALPPATKHQPFGHVIVSALERRAFTALGKIQNVNDAGKLYVSFDYLQLRTHIWFSGVTGKEIHRPKTASYPAFQLLLATYTAF